MSPKSTLDSAPPFISVFTRGFEILALFFVYSGIDHFNVYLEKETNTRRILHTYFVIELNFIQCSLE